MNRARITALVALVTLPAGLLVSGCRGSAVKELSEQIVAEALITQAVVAYNEVAIDVTVNDRSVSMSCGSGGTVDWSDAESSGQVCYTTSSQGCSFSNGNGNSFTIEGSSTLCGADDFVVQEGAVYSGQQFQLTGSSTVTTNQGSRTCEYDLAVSNGVTRDGGSSYEVEVSGSICGRPFETRSMDIYVDADIEVESGG